MSDMRRRDFITLLGGTAAWPVVARAQKPEMPVIGLLDNRAAETTADRLRGFYHGLRESGYVEGESVSIIYRWADGDNRRLPELAANPVNRRVAVIAATGGTPTALVAKAATTTIPVVFAVPEDPVALGLVASLPHPGGNLTGVNFFNAEVAAKAWRSQSPPAAAGGKGATGANRRVACRQQPRDRCCLCDDGAGASRRALCHGRFSVQYSSLAAGPAGGTARITGLLPVAGLSCLWRSDELRDRRNRRFSSGRCLCRTYPQRCETCRPAGGAGRKISARDQCSDRAPS